MLSDLIGRHPPCAWLVRQAVRRFAPDGLPVLRGYRRNFLIRLAHHLTPLAFLVISYCMAMRLMAQGRSVSDVRRMATKFAFRSKIGTL